MYLGFQIIWLIMRTNIKILFLLLVLIACDSENELSHHEQLWQETVTCMGAEHLDLLIPEIIIGETIDDIPCTISTACAIANCSVVAFLDDSPDWVIIHEFAHVLCKELGDPTCGFNPVNLGHSGECFGFDNTVPGAGLTALCTDGTGFAGYNN